jgi:hypothetical protein
MITKKSQWMLLSFLFGSQLFAEPLKVYIMAGQSNMQGHATESTLPYMSEFPETKPLLSKIVDENNKPKVYSKVHVAAFSEQGRTPREKKGVLTIGFGKNLTRSESFGPELGFGITVYEKLKEPILIIKTAWGGKSLHTDFRPPSAGPYEHPEQIKQLWEKNPKGVHGVPKLEDREKYWEGKRKLTGVYYQRMIKSVKEVLANPGKFCSDYNSKDGVKLAGLVWFQGWNDMCDSTAYPARGKVGRFDEYTNLLSHFIRDVRKDLSVPKMPVVIGVMGVGGSMEHLKKGDAYEFRKAMKGPTLLPEFKDNVTSVSTGDFWDFEIAKLDGIFGKHWGRGRVKFGQMKKVEFKKLSRDERRKYVQEQNAYANEYVLKIWKKTYPDRVKDYDKLLKARSNGGYHYLGAGKILSQIGVAFGNAMLDEF